MIEIPASSISAGMGAVGMHLAVIAIVYGVYTKKYKDIAIAIAILLVIDLIMCLASYGYATAPNYDNCETNWAVSLDDCITYKDPTTNPFEKQPLHPLLWMWSLWINSAEWSGENIKVV